MYQLSNNHDPGIKQTCLNIKDKGHKTQTIKDTESIHPYFRPTLRKTDQKDYYQKTN